MEMHKMAASCFEHILEGITHKTTAVWPLTANLTNHLNKANKTCETLLEKQELTHKRRSLMDSYTWTHQCWSTSKYLKNQLCADIQREDLPGKVQSSLVWFGLVWFYGISTIVGYLMPNLFLHI